MEARGGPVCFEVEGDKPRDGRRGSVESSECWADAVRVVSCGRFLFFTLHRRYRESSGAPAAPAAAAAGAGRAGRATAAIGAASGRGRPGRAHLSPDDHDEHQHHAHESGRQPAVGEPEGSTASSASEGRRVLVGAGRGRGTPACTGRTEAHGEDAHYVKYSRS